MQSAEIVRWLKETDENRLNELFSMADNIRKEHVGDDVHLRALLEISNTCCRRCMYCGLNADNADIKRYRMNTEEILATVSEASGMGYGTVVMQSGEDFGLSAEWFCELIKEIKNTTDMAVTLSFGERSEKELAMFKEAGADRYLLRFETSNEELFRKIHPPLKENSLSRIDILKIIKQFGYETGSGIMTGIPGQSWEDVARDIELFKELDLDMIGLGPYIAHPDTPLASDKGNLPEGQQVSGGVDTAYKVMALTRILCPDVNIPCTTAVTVLKGKTGFLKGLSVGANVIMPDFTPDEYRCLYQIYPGKSENRTNRENDAKVRKLIADNGRAVGKGKGNSLNMERKHER